MLLRCLFLLLLLPAPGWPQSQLPLGSRATAAIDAPASLFGNWGTAAQCKIWRERERAASSEVLYHLDREWLLQGGIYCYLTWRGRYPLTDGLEIHALAQCGEDTLREYDLVLRLRDDQLQLRWSEDFSTRPLLRCD